MMADHLRVDPIDLSMSSDHMDMHHGELLAAHTAANGTIEEAQTGWVGASAAALQSKLAEWQAVTAEFMPRHCRPRRSLPRRRGRVSKHRHR